MLSLKISKKINIKLGEKWIKIVGPLGSVLKKKPKDIRLYFDKQSNHLYFLNKNNEKAHFYFSLINNIIWGLYKGFTSKLVMIGIGYKAIIEKDKLILKLGYSHDIIYHIPEEITINLIPKQKNIALFIFGNNKQKVNQITAEIRNIKPPEPYKGKGIKYFDEVIIIKQGKKN